MLSVMSARFIKKRWVTLTIALLFILAACDLFPESMFQLAPESRLPRWYVFPKGVERKDVSLEMRYYIVPKPKVMFILERVNGRRISKIESISLGPSMNSKGKERSPGEYPSYKVVKVNGVVDVIEHRKMNDIFYLCDDPLIWKALGVPYFGASH
jgi:hypothetical protein